MSDHIEVVLPTNDLRAIDLSRQNSFSFEVWASQKIPEGIDDAASPSSDDALRVASETCAVFGREI